MIMCSESKPCECHRSKLIGEVLLKLENISLQHIDEKGMVKDQKKVICELNKGSYEDLFGNITFISRKAYL